MLSSMKAVHSAQSAWLEYPVAVHVEHARELLGSELAALVGESYERAYPDMVRVQQLTELEEVIDYSQAEAITNGEPDFIKHSLMEHRSELYLCNQMAPAPAEASTTQSVGGTVYSGWLSEPASTVYSRGYSS